MIKVCGLHEGHWLGGVGSVSARLLVRFGPRVKELANGSGKGVSHERESLSWRVLGGRD